MYSGKCRLIYTFFFLMAPPPPKSTLFPYTTSSDLGAADGEGGHVEDQGHLVADGFGVEGLLIGDVRSEEHTSELQSLTNLVCRLLLEKKKRSSPVSFTKTNWLDFVSER